MNISKEYFNPPQFPHGEAPHSIEQLVDSLNFRITKPVGTVLFLMLRRMSNNNKPINGFACLAGPYSSSGCFASMFADPILASGIKTSLFC